MLNTDVGRAGRLRHAVVNRYISRGLVEAYEAMALIEQASLTKSNQIELLVEVALWIDLDFALRARVAQSIRRWSNAKRRGLSVRHGWLLRFVDSTLEMHIEGFEGAIAGFQEVLRALERKELLDPQLCVIALFHVARCRHYQGRYADGDGGAMFFADEARAHASGLDGESLQVALIDVLRSRILLKSEPLRKAAPIAAQLLSDAQKAFRDTDDHVTKGNILTSLAQLAKRAPHRGLGPVELLDTAMSEFGQHPVKDHPAESRARIHRARLLLERALHLRAPSTHQVRPVSRHGNDSGQLTAFVVDLGPRLKRVVKEQHLIKELDAFIRAIEPSLDHDPPGDDGRDSINLGVEQFSRLAQEDLEVARRISRSLLHWRGLSHGLTVTGYMLLSGGDSDGALKAGEEAYELGRGKSHTVQARAAILCAEAEYETSLWGVEDGVDHIVQARDWAEKAMIHGQHVEPRILGCAHCWMGLTRLLGVAGSVDRQQAEFHRDEAKKIFRDFSGVSLQRVFDLLQQQLNQGHEAAALLRRWADNANGVAFAHLENAITRHAWEAAHESIPEFEKLLDITRHKAEGLLGRAGIRKMPLTRMKVYD